MSLFHSAPAPPPPPPPPPAPPVLASDAISQAGAQERAAAAAAAGGQGFDSTYLSKGVKPAATTGAAGKLTLGDQ